MPDPIILEIAYGRTINIGNFENVRLEFRVQVPKGTSYEDTLERIKQIADREEAKIRREHS